MKSQHLLALLFSVFTLLARANASPPDTVAEVNLDRYTGTWYEIARYPFKQQKGCYNTTATYSRNADGTIKVVNRCRKGGFGAPESTAVAKAKVVDASGNAKLKVKFFSLAPWADYWIIRLGKDYDYAVVSQPDRKYLWILSRTPVMEARLYEEVVSGLSADHFDVTLLEKTPQKWGAEPAYPSSLAILSPYLNSLAVALSFMALLWVFSLILKDSSIVDRFWGVGFIVLSAQQLLQNRFLTFRATLILVLVVIWGARLSLYIHLRNRKRPEDPRYQAMRKARAGSYWWKSLFIVFGLQGFLMWTIAAPLAVIHLFPQSDVPTLLDILGVILWGIGFLFETIADYQMALFKRAPENRGKVCRQGLWNLTRHPNYFGETLVWWGYFLIALNVDFGWVTLFSPLLMWFLLLRVSGVALLEKQLTSTKPGYADYVREVPAFFPFKGKNRSLPG